MSGSQWDTWIALPCRQTGSVGSVRDPVNPLGHRFDAAHPHSCRCALEILVPFLDSGRLVADHLEVVAVRADHERGVVVRVVLRAQARRAVVLAAGFDGRLVKGIYRLAICVMLVKSTVSAEH